MNPCLSSPALDKSNGRQSALALVQQPAKENENSDLKSCTGNGKENQLSFAQMVGPTKMP